MKSPVDLIGVGTQLMVSCICDYDFCVCNRTPHPAITHIFGANPYDSAGLVEVVYKNESKMLLSDTYQPRDEDDKDMREEKRKPQVFSYARIISSVGEEIILDNEEITIGCSSSKSVLICDKVPTVEKCCHCGNQNVYEVGRYPYTTMCTRYCMSCNKYF